MLSDATAQSVTTLSFPEATDVHLESTYLFNVLGTAKDGSHTTYMAMPTLTAISGSPIPTDPSKCPPPCFISSHDAFNCGPPYSHARPWSD